MSEYFGITDWLNDLGLHQRRKGDTGEESWIVRLRKDSPVEEIISFLGTLYEVLQGNAEMAEILAKNGFPAEILAQGAAEVKALAAAKIAKEEARAAVPQRIVERNQAYETFLKWLDCALEAAALARKEIKRSKVSVSVTG